jgi:hypothetical protein
MARQHRIKYQHERPSITAHSAYFGHFVWRRSRKTCCGKKSWPICSKRAAARSPDRAPGADLWRPHAELPRTERASRPGGLPTDRRRRAARARSSACGCRAGSNCWCYRPAIAKAGAAWLPVDEDTPVERLQICLDDADGAGVVSCAAFAPRLAALSRLRPAGVDRRSAAGRARCLMRCCRAARAVSPDVPAYVIYTSGSTGKPKGILITQRSICHFLRSENAVLGVTAATRCIKASRSPSTCRLKKSGSPTCPARRCGSAPRKSAAIPKPCRACWSRTR